jgi:hypothetical protein
MADTISFSKENAALVLATIWLHHQDHPELVVNLTLRQQAAYAEMEEFAEMGPATRYFYAAHAHAATINLSAPAPEELTPQKLATILKKVAWDLEGDLDKDDHFRIVNSDKIVQMVIHRNTPLFIRWKPEMIGYREVTYKAYLSRAETNLSAYFELSTAILKAAQANPQGITLLQQ